MFSRCRSIGREYVISIHLPPWYTRLPRSFFTQSPPTIAVAEPAGLSARCAVCCAETIEPAAIIAATTVKPRRFIFLLFGQAEACPYVTTNRSRYAVRAFAA